MISKIKYDAIPKPTKDTLKEKPYQFIFILLSIIVIFITSGKAIFFIFVLIILFGIFRHIFHLLTKKT
jgi:CDP-diacylglycerol--serine O-phosphatidyltransferase